MGPSGSGKSTLLNIIGLLDRPTSGRLFIKGQDTGALGDAEITHLRGHTIGFVFQYHLLISAFTALENVMMPMLVDRGFPGAEIEQRATRAAGAGRPGKVRRQSRQQHVGRPAAARRGRARAGDEPRSRAGRRADRQSRHEIRRRRLRTDARRSTGDSGTSFLLVTHNLDLARRCDRIIEVVDGRIQGS